MTNKNEVIDKWEAVEVQRSASEAQKAAQDLIVEEKNVGRYLSPPAETCFYLEYSYSLLGDIAGKTVLDYGCGTGCNSMILSKRGAKVIGVDISPDLLEIAEKRMAANGIEPGSTTFMVGSAHDLPIPSESIDIVFGIAILHHLDLEESSKEVFRVLKKGGRAIFQEPVRNSKFVKFIRSLIPYEQPDISPFERPLTDRELKNYAKDFSAYKSRAFSLPFVNLLEVLRVSDTYFQKAVKIDRKFLNKIPAMSYYATVNVVEMTK